LGAWKGIGSEAPFNESAIEPILAILPVGSFKGMNGGGGRN